MLLTNAGIQFSADAPAIDELQLIAANPCWAPIETSLSLAQAKALNVSCRTPNALVIGSDQVLACGGQIYSKPKNVDEARQQLSELRGRQHQLISSVACTTNSTVLWHATAEANLKMRNFTDNFLEHYLIQNGLNSLNSVGGYQIEQLGSQLFDSIEGDYFTIMGLPLLPLMQFLRQAGELPS
jgi:septum formation protein